MDTEGIKKYRALPQFPIMVVLALTDYTGCPQCEGNKPLLQQGTSVIYDLQLRRHRCQQCGWKEDTISLPLWSFLTGEPLSGEELLSIIKEELREQFGIREDGDEKDISEGANSPQET